MAFLHASCIELVYGLMSSILQVRFAFVAGVAVVVLLIPVNYFLAKRIESASQTMMSCKDSRIKRTSEMLRGIKQIKAAAWEPCFIASVRPLYTDVSYFS